MTEQGLSGETLALKAIAAESHSSPWRYWGYQFERFDMIQLKKKGERGSYIRARFQDSGGRERESESESEREREREQEREREKEDN